MVDSPKVRWRSTVAPLNQRILMALPICPAAAPGINFRLLPFVSLLTRRSFCSILDTGMQVDRQKSDWTEFKQVAARRFPDRIYATLNPKGEFVVNLKTFKAMGSPEAFVLLFDARTRSIGLRPSTIDTPNALLARIRHKRYNRVIRSWSFLQENGIKLDRTVQFPTAYIDREGILVLDLKDMIPAAHMSWKKHT